MWISLAQAASTTHDRNWTMQWKVCSYGARLKAAVLALAVTPLCVVGSARAEDAVSRETERKQVSLTVYNQDFALVREVRQLQSLGSGRASLEFRDIASTIQPETVAIRPLAGAHVRVLEQNYRFDLLTPETLLEKYVGRSVRTYRDHPAKGKEDRADATLLSVTNGQVLQIGDEITFNYPGRLAFPELPPNLIAKPTLFWLLESQTPKPSVEVSYLAQSLSWNADYVLVVDDEDKKANLSGWVTLVNNSGASYRNAELKLVAGNINRIRYERPRAVAFKSAPEATRVPAFREEGLFEYHLYTLARRTDVLDKEQKQVALLEASGISVSKKLLFASNPYWFREQISLPDTQKVRVLLQLRNTQQNHLGMPLPKGIVRVYKADEAGQKQFLGEDSIDHTPRDERLEIQVGTAFDVIAERKQTEWHELSDCSAESAWQIEIRNHKDENVAVEMRERIDADQTLLQSSQAARKVDAGTFAFDLTVPKRGHATLSYRVRVRWC